jgi:hypothetical protein
VWFAHDGRVSANETAGASHADDRFSAASIDRLKFDYATPNKIDFRAVRTLFYKLHSRGIKGRRCMTSNLFPDVGKRYRGWARFLVSQDRRLCAQSVPADRASASRRRFFSRSPIHSGKVTAPIVLSRPNLHRTSKGLSNLYRASSIQHNASSDKHRLKIHYSLSRANTANVKRYAAVEWPFEFIGCN